MSPTFDPIPGAGGYQHSNPPVLSTIPLIAHLDILERCGGIEALRVKSLKLTQYLYDLLTASKYYRPADGSVGFRILTPSDPARRGCQLSILVLPAGSGTMDRVFDRMQKDGVVGDERRPDVIRLSPVPLYNRFEDVKIAVETMERALDAERSRFTL
jgi:kynureninase